MNKYKHKRFTINQPDIYLYQLKEYIEGVTYTHPRMCYFDLYSILENDMKQQSIKVHFELSDDYDEPCTIGKCQEKSRGYTYTIHADGRHELGVHYCKKHGLEHVFHINHRLREIQDIMTRARDED